MGEWHLAQAHLPKLLRLQLKGPADVLILHQDVERLYFKLAQKQKRKQCRSLKGPRQSLLSDGVATLDEVAKLSYVSRASL